MLQAVREIATTVVHQPVADVIKKFLLATAELAKNIQHYWAIIQRLSSNFTRPTKKALLLSYNIFYQKCKNISTTIVC